VVGPAGRVGGGGERSMESSGFDVFYCWNLRTFWKSVYTGCVLRLEPITIEY